MGTSKQFVSQVTDLPEQRAPSAQTLFELVSSNRIDDARALLASAGAAEVVHGEFARWARVLAPPATSTSTAKRPDRARDFQWLRDNSARYPKTWVAVFEGALVGSAARLSDLLGIVRERGVEGLALIHHVP